MFRYPNVKPQQVVSAEQRCCYCEQWFSLNQTDIEKLNALWRRIANNEDPFASETAMVQCTHCGKTQLLTAPGKYDHPSAPKQQCHVQFLTLVEEKRQWQ